MFEGWNLEKPFQRGVEFEYVPAPEADSRSLRGMSEAEVVARSSGLDAIMFCSSVDRKWAYLLRQRPSCKMLTGGVKHRYWWYRVSGEAKGESRLSSSEVMGVLVTRAEVGELRQIRQREGSFRAARLIYVTT